MLLTVERVFASDRSVFKPRFLPLIICEALDKPVFFPRTFSAVCKRVCMPSPPFHEEQSEGSLDIIYVNA